MKTLLQQLTNSARRVKLDPRERRFYKNQFKRFMRLEPIEQPESRLARIFSLRALSSPMPYIAGLAVLIIAGGGVSFAADSTLPGDTLYPVKVSINEELRGMLYTTANSKAVYEAARVTNRLEEMEALTARGEIDQSTLTKLSANIDSHIASIKAYTSEPDPVAIIATSSTTSIKMATGTSATSSTGTSTNATSTGTSTETIAITTATTSAKSNASHGTTTNGTTTIQKAQSKQQLETLRKHVEDTAEELPGSQEESLKNKLESASEHYKDGIRALRDKNTADAQNAFTTAQKTMHSIEKELRDRIENSAAMSSIDIPDTLATSTTSNSSAPTTTSTSSHVTSTEKK